MGLVCGLLVVENWLCGSGVDGSRTWTTAVMSGYTRQTSLKLPAVGNITLNAWPETIGGVLTQVEPSKDAAPTENPGQPTKNGGRTWPNVRNVMVWISSAPTVQLTVSPA